MRAGLTPDRLVHAGADLADAEGLDAVTLSALARHFDVRPASLYAHVTSTDDLRTRITLLALEELADRLAAALAGRAGRDALTALADTYRDHAREHPGRYAATQRRLDPAAAAASAGPRHSAMTAAVLRGYDVPPEEHPHAVRLLGAFIRGWVNLEQGGSFDHSAPGSETSWRRALDALDHLLTTWPRRTP